MALEDKDLFNAICSRYGDQPLEFIMEQYEKAKIMNLQIERRIGDLTVAPPAEEIAVVEEEAVDETPEEQPRKKYTRRDLKYSPQSAITDDSVTCCLCGAERQILTSTHLATHGITVDEYKKLCRYSPDQKLMSGKRHAKSKEVIGKAQQTRLDRIAEKRNDMNM